MKNRDEEITYLIDNGKLWRAKEILQGRIQQMGYDPDQYEQYGQVLLAMNDNIQAGKFLFLSGSRKPEYENCIHLYVKRYTTKNKLAIIDTFPKAVRISSDDSYPPQVLKDLTILGITPDIIRRKIQSFPIHSSTLYNIYSFLFLFLYFF